MACSFCQQRRSYYLSTATCGSTKRFLVRFPHVFQQCDVRYTIPISHHFVRNVWLSSFSCCPVSVSPSSLGKDFFYFFKSLGSRLVGIFGSSSPSSSSANRLSSSSRSCLSFRFASSTVWGSAKQIVLLHVSLSLVVYFLDWRHLYALVCNGVVLYALLF